MTRAGLMVVAALVAALALEQCLALELGNKASNKLLRLAITREKLSPDQVLTMLQAVDDKQNTYVGQASVRFLLTYEDVSLGRCLNLSKDKEERNRFGVCHLHNLEYIDNVLAYCRDRLAKQADLCSAKVESIVETQLSAITKAELDSVSQLTEAVLADKEEFYAWDAPEDRAQFYFWTHPTVTRQQYPLLTRGCDMILRMIGQIRLIPKYARYFGKLKLPSGSLNKWFSAMQVCRTYRSLFTTFDEKDSSRVLLSEASLDTYYT